MAGEHTGVLARLAAAAPFMVPMHCMAHRTDLAAEALEKAKVLQRIISLLHAVYNHFAYSTKRIQALLQAAMEAETSGNKPKKDAETRWISMKEPLARLLSEYDALLTYFETDSEPAAIGIYGQLTDAELLLAMAAVTPALRSMECFIKQCQDRNLFVGDLAVKLARLRRTLDELYINDDTSYQPVDFPELAELLAVGGPANRWQYGMESDEGDGGQAAGLVAAGRFHSFTCTERTGRPGRPRTVPLTADNLAPLLSAVKATVTEAVTVLVQALAERFPPVPLLEAFAIVYPQYYSTQPPPSESDFQRRPAVIIERYCVARPGQQGEVKPLLNRQALIEQASFFRKAMMAAVAEELAVTRRAEAEARRAAAETQQADREDEAGSSGDTDNEDNEAEEAAGSGSDREEGWAAMAAATAGARCRHSRRHKRRQGQEVAPALSQATKVWRRLTATLAGQCGLSEYAAMAELVFVMVPGSVEDERRFSAMSFLIKNKTRNSLCKNLSLCVRMFSQRFFTQEDFPYGEALKQYKEAAVVRGRYVK
ncbi:hypothetical protein GPECTOR_31g329 [Gonium pectorale]|uniref:HAT C-terminal dimerisation domain-containing protein n=1 Tax=Gonium pectorale TaxID=33097 RepID=A0A150GDP4_GONPE|nr:hypothetical protein GPECTOR_31g329 [Gonium pectorale]|eukprot:KXZ47967.1 hypothetical protein GPECTOR_31g329 [Gonium pectorale]